MFTGLVEMMGTIRKIHRKGNSMRIEIETNEAFKQLEIGESIAVNGVCLTVESFYNQVFVATIMESTYVKTTFQKTETGKLVNLERALQLNDRLGGHMVSGHVDGCIRLQKITIKGSSKELKFVTTQNLIAQIYNRGSVCIDGVSLTVSSTDISSFSVSVIPHTYQNTTLQYLKSGDFVNLETDSMIKAMLQTKNGLKTVFTIEKLKMLGY